MFFFNSKIRVTLIGLILGLLMGGCAEESEFERTKRLAIDGDASAQYNLGVMYNNGTGVPQDYKESYAWSSLAKADGQELAEKILGIVTKEMTKEQITEAQSLSIEIFKRIEANRKD